MMASVLHFIPDADDPFAIVAQLRDAVVSGNYIALSHGTPPPRAARGVQDQPEAVPADPDIVSSTQPRAGGEAVHGWELVEPNIVSVTDWHADPDDDPDIRAAHFLAAVGRKP